MSERCEELLLLWEEGEITPEQLQELTLQLAGDSQARRQAVRHFTLSAAIDEQLREAQHEEMVVSAMYGMSFDQVQTTERNARQRGRRRWLGVAALLVALVAAYMLNLHQRLLDLMGGPASRLPQVVQRFGEVELVRADGSTEFGPQGRVEFGQQLRTSPHSYLTLKYADGTSIQLRGDSQIKIEPSQAGKQLTLQRGGLFAQVSPQRTGAPLVINPGRFDQVVVVGTRFELERIEQASFVRVDQGQVEFGAAEKAVVVSQRQESTALVNLPPQQPRAVQSAIWRGWDRGLRGEYFNQPNFRGESFTRIDPRIDFHWGRLPPDPSIHGPFSVRWTGEVEAPHSGEFVFYTVAHYGVRLWVNGQKLINSGASMGAEEDTSPIQLEKGRRYTIRIEYWDQHGDAKMRLLWSSKSLPKTVVDQQWLYPAAEKSNVL